MKHYKKIIGQVVVDSGQLVIIDPCYVGGDWNQGEAIAVDQVAQTSYTPSEALGNRIDKYYKLYCSTL